jgi:hypothetical protein
LELKAVLKYRIERKGESTEQRIDEIRLKENRRPEAKRRKIAREKEQRTRNSAQSSAEAPFWK